MALTTNPQDHHVPASSCPQCHKEMDGALGLIDERRPNPGDISICIHCLALSVFTDKLSLREPTSDELKQIAGNRDILAALDILAAVKADKP